jgi:hypothetical protein
MVPSMPKTGVASLPLHPGKAPRWLFKRMVALSKGISEVLVYEYGTMSFYDGFLILSGFRLFRVFLGMIGIRLVPQRSPVVH